MKLNIKMTTPPNGLLKKLMKDQIQKAIQEVDVESNMLDGYIESDLQLRSTYLANSNKVEKKEDSIEVGTNVEYAKIHEFGGFNGINNKAFQRPRYFFSKGLKRVAKALYDSLVKNFNNFR